MGSAGRRTSDWARFCWPWRRFGPKGCGDEGPGGIRAVLRTALAQALKWQLVAWNVAVLVDLPRASRPQFRVMEPKGARELLKVAADHRLGPLFSVALAVGLRLGESLGLAWDDVDLSTRTLRVRRALQRFDGKLHFVEPKSESSNRSVALPESAVVVLGRHRVRQQTERLLAGQRWRDTGLVFTTTIGTPLDDRNVRKAFRELLDAAELPPMRIHDLRHTCTSLLLAQGVHSRVVMETLDTYSHVMPTLERNAADRMDAVLTGSG
jgi:integrase